MVKDSGDFRLGVCSLFVLSFFVCSCAKSTPRPFSSGYVFTAPGSSPTTGKIYFSWPYYRQDSDGGGLPRLITNYSTRISYIIWLDERKYTETLAPEYTFDGQNPCTNRSDIACRKIGPESVNGRACDKWETTDRKNGRLGSVCVDRELHYPISVHSADGATFEYINIKAGPQAPSLFEIPFGYKKLPDPFGRLKD